MTSQSVNNQTVCSKNPDSLLTDEISPLFVRYKSLTQWHNTHNSSLNNWHSCGPDDSYILLCIWQLVQLNKLLSVASDDTVDRLLRLLPMLRCYILVYSARIYTIVPVFKLSISTFQDRQCRKSSEVVSISKVFSRFPAIVPGPGAILNVLYNIFHWMASNRC